MEEWVLFTFNFTRIIVQDPRLEDPYALSNTMPPVTWNVSLFLQKEPWILFSSGLCKLHTCPTLTVL